MKPTKIKHPCKAPGCSMLLPALGYCPKHRKQRGASKRDYDKRRMNDERLAMAARIRSGPKWKKVRRIKIAMNPLCEDPLKRHGRSTASAEHVHHVKPLVVAPELAYVLDNLQSLCARCHSIIEAGTDRGGPSD